MPKFILGAHSLSAMFSIQSCAALKEAMRTTTDNGGTLFEIPYLLCKLPWESVATVARRTRIREISLCHFFPRNLQGAPAGDPLGTKAEVKKALSAIDDIIKAAAIIRKDGIKVRFIDGPTWGCLGWEYAMPIEEKRERAAQFLYQAGNKCAAADLILAVEFLRPHEDKVIGGTEAMIKVLEDVDHTCVEMHFDVFHSLECGEDPATSIRLAKKWIAYLHLHGNDRRAPGSEDETCNWKKIIAAIKTIDSGVEEIPIVPEPFGPETIKENPELGAGLPVPPPLSEYLPIAYKTLKKAGLKVATPELF